MTDEEIEKRQTYLTNQPLSKLVDLEKMLYRELKQNRESKQKYMSDKEFFEPLLKKIEESKKNSRD